MLIPEWRQAWRLHSVQLSAAGAALSSAWLAMSADQQGQVLAFLHIDRPGTLAVVGFIAVLLGRLKNQQGV